MGRSPDVFGFALDLWRVKRRYRFELMIERGLREQPQAHQARKRSMSRKSWLFAGSDRGADRAAFIDADHERQA